MRVSVERRHQRGQVAKFLDAFAASASRAGFDVDRSAGRGAGVTVVWNGRRHAGRGPTLYCEHGWLPRWEYQISTRGINADSHAAPFRWNGEALSERNVSEALAMRDLAADLRAADPFRQGGGKGFTKADRSRFLDALERALR